MQSKRRGSVIESELVTDGAFELEDACKAPRLSAAGQVR